MKSSFCGATGCIHLVDLDDRLVQTGMVGMMSDTSPNTSIVATKKELATFILGVKNNEFDHLCQEELDKLVEEHNGKVHSASS